MLQSRLEKQAFQEEKPFLHTKTKGVTIPPRKAGISRKI